MARLLHEIWIDEGSFTMTAVGLAHDELRSNIAPHSVRVHSYYASSDFEARRLNYEYHGFDPWMPEPDWEERSYSDQEQQEQEAYVRQRNC